MGNRDGTTCILVFFMCFNDDVYSFRLDFPHIKENAIYTKREKVIWNLTGKILKMLKLWKIF